MATHMHCIALSVRRSCSWSGLAITALEWACRRGNAAVVRFLMDEAGGMVNPLGKDGCSEHCSAGDDKYKFVCPFCPLAWACYTNELGIAKMLVEEYGACPAGVEKTYNIPITHLAAENGSLHCVQYLVDTLGYVCMHFPHLPPRHTPHDVGVLFDDGSFIFFLRIRAHVHVCLPANLFVDSNSRR